MTGAKKYEGSAGRVDTRAGSYTRKLQTKAGEVELKVPRLRKLPFETQVIERYKRRETSVEEALDVPRRRFPAARLCVCERAICSKWKTSPSRESS